MNYQALLSYIAQRVYENTNQEISGTDLKESLDEIVAQLGAEFQFGGVVAHNATLPVGFGDYNVVYIGIEAGTYTNFGGAVLDGETIHFLTYNGSWSDTDTGIPTSTAFATKADKDADAVEGNIAKFDSNGNPLDGGVPADNLAQKDGYYSQLVSGAAENIVGRSSVPASFLFRTTGGSADVGTGAAQIKELGGNGLVWNQLANEMVSNSDAGITWTAQADGSLLVNGTSDGALYGNVSRAINFIANHKYAFITSNIRFGLFNDAAGVNVSGSSIFTPTANSAINIQFIVYAAGVSFTNEKVWFIVVDLTKLFNGSVPEGYSVADFKADFPLPYYAYNTGEILPFSAEWLKTTGVNQWDEELLYGYTLDNTTGEASINPSYAISNNYIPVIPDTLYNIHIGKFAGFSGYGAPIFAYDADKNFIGKINTSGVATTFTTPSNCCYIRFRLIISEYSDSYLHDICINLSWSGTMDGQYFPYEEHLFNIPISTMTGKVNGEGESVTIFGADGIVKAGSVSDVLQVDADGYARKAIKKIGKVDLGTLNANYSGGKFDVSVPLIKIPSQHNIVCERYVVTTSYDPDSLSDKEILGATGYQFVYIKDADKTSADLVDGKMAWLNGVYLYYELATPVEYVLDNPIFMGYYANDWGTECWGNKGGGAFVPAVEATEPYTAPSNYNVQYALNAADMLTNLVRNYMSINANGADESSMKALAGALSTALGIAISWTWDEATRKYTFAVADNRTFKVVAVPASASATGTAGNIAYDSDYLYVCVATDTWKRVALSTW